MLIFNFGHYEFWEAYDPNNDFFGTQLVSFDGIERIIYVNEGVTSLDVKDDIYSAWKEWVKYQDNAKYAQAFTAIGGQPITNILFVGTTYFLENGWRIQPWPGEYVLTIDGNIFTREPGENPMVPVSGVSVSLSRSNLVDLIVAEPVLSGNLAITISNTSIQDIANNVWEEVINDKGTTARDQLGRKIATKTQDIALS